MRATELSERGRRVKGPGLKGGHPGGPDRKSTMGDDHPVLAPLAKFVPDSPQKSVDLEAENRGEFGRNPDHNLFG